MKSFLKNSFFEKVKKIQKKLKSAKKILILTHQGPDGDAVASSLALNIFLKKIKKETFVYIPQLPNYLKFLPGYSLIKKRKKDIPYKNFDLIFALDFAEKKRIVFPPFLKLDEKKIISIDHHLSKEKVGEIQILDSKASATCEILYFIFKAMNQEIKKNLATCLLAGIFGDTLYFSLISKKSQKVVADLIKQADLQKIAFFSHKIPFFQIKILAKILKRLKKDDKLNLIYSWILLKDLKEIKEAQYLQEPPFFPDFIAQIEGAKIFLLLSERKNNFIKGSLRSRDNFDVLKIAKKFGGGGHKRAAGFKVKGRIFEVLEKVKEEIKKLIEMDKKMI